jgi:hypothetical protein
MSDGRRGVCSTGQQAWRASRRPSWRGGNGSCRGLRRRIQGQPLAASVTSAAHRHALHHGDGGAAGDIADQRAHVPLAVGTQRIAGWQPVRRRCRSASPRPSAGRAVGRHRGVEFAHLDARCACGSSWAPASAAPSGRRCRRRRRRCGSAAAATACGCCTNSLRADRLLDARSAPADGDFLPRLRVADDAQVHGAAVEGPAPPAATGPRAG